MENHRVLMLALSDRMSTDDVQRLLFVCPSVEFSEGITKGYQLFVKLERMGLLGPGNYSYLSEQLKQIGRIDLDNMLPFQGSAISFVPTSLQAPWNTLETIFLTKERKMIGFRDALSRLVNNSQEWEACMNVASKVYTGYFTVQNQCETMTATRLQHFPGAMWNALAFTEEYTTNYLVYIASIDWPEPSVLQTYVMKMMASWESFRDAEPMDPRFKQISPPSEHDYKQPTVKPNILSDRACECMETICMGLVDLKKTKTEMNQARERISALSYCCVGTSTVFPMLSWLLSCVFLAATSQIDLKPYRSCLKALVMKHKELIEEFYHSIATILDHRILQLALADVDIDTTHLSNSSDPHHYQLILVPWLSILILLVALGNENKEIEKNDCCKILAQMSKFIQQDKMIQLGLQFAHKTSLATRFEIENLKGRIIKLCPPTSPQGILIKRLLALD